MTNKNNATSKRKSEHIEICLNEDVGFHGKTNGFEHYEFEHFAVTELNYREISLETEFLGKKISYPFLISCMTGGASEAENLNEKLAEAAKSLNIAIGAGSQRQALENDDFLESYKIIRRNAGGVPVLGNIGAAQVSKMKDLSPLQKLVDAIEADALAIHLNPLQELLQPEGEPDFGGFLRNLEKAANILAVPIIVKEVGAGVSAKAAKKLLDAGAKGIDVAGAGGTSWAAVEMIRNKSPESDYFRNWGVPTAEAIAQTVKLKKKYDFVLIGSGGITNGVEIAKAIALGADIAASALPVLKAAAENGTRGAVDLLSDWFDTVKKIMYLTESKNINKLKKSKLKRISR